MQKINEPVLERANYLNSMSRTPVSFKTPEPTFKLTSQSKIQDYLQANRQWALQKSVAYPDLFDKNGVGQDPHTLWIGCSDSRYNENVLGVNPGEVFTYKNIANMVNPNDNSTLSTLEFAINVLKVKKVILCGHTDCGGIKTCLKDQRQALPGMACGHLANYLEDIDQLKVESAEQLANAEDKPRMLSILNVKKQVSRLLENETVKAALARGDIEVHGLLYNVDSGLLEVIN